VTQRRVGVHVVVAEDPTGDVLDAGGPERVDPGAKDLKAVVALLVTADGGVAGTAHDQVAAQGVVHDRALPVEARSETVVGPELVEGSSGGVELDVGGGHEAFAGLALVVNGPRRGVGYFEAPEAVLQPFRVDRLLHDLRQRRALRQPRFFGAFLWQRRGRVRNLRPSRKRTAERNSVKHARKNEDAQQ
jgi:hypothetical protein